MNGALIAASGDGNGIRERNDDGKDYSDSYKSHIQIWFFFRSRSLPPPPPPRQTRKREKPYVRVCVCPKLVMHFNAVERCCCYCPYACKGGSSILFHVGDAAARFVLSSSLFLIFCCAAYARCASSLSIFMPSQFMFEPKWKSVEST